MEDKSIEICEIPEQFEFIEAQWQFENRPEISKFVTILDKFEHHYSHEMMYHIRIESLYVLFGDAKVEYKTVKESDILDMLKTRKG